MPFFIAHCSIEVTFHQSITLATNPGEFIALKQEIYHISTTNQSTKWEKRWLWTFLPLFFSWFRLISLKLPIINHGIERKILMRVNHSHTFSWYSTTASLCTKVIKTWLPSIMILTSIIWSLISKILTSISLEYIRAKTPLLPT